MAQNMKWFCSYSQSCQGGRLLSELLPPWTILTTREIFNYKGLDIKLAQFWIIQKIGLDFLYNARFGVPLGFPCSLLRKIQRTSKNPSNIAPLMVQYCLITYLPYTLERTPVYPTVQYRRYRSWINRQFASSSCLVNIYVIRTSTGYPFLRIEGKFYINIGSTFDPLKGYSELGRLPFFKCRWPSLGGTYATSNMQPALSHWQAVPLTSQPWAEFKYLKWQVM